MNLLEHLTQPPRAESTNRRPPLLLLLHGVGSHEHDLMGLAPYVDPRFFVISARAPIMLAPGAFAWFHLEFTPAGPSIKPEEAEASRLRLLRFIGGAVERYGLDPKRVYLMGFSQGAIMSLSVALTEPRRLAGVVAMSGRVLPEILPKLAPPEEMTGLPIFVVHGTDDVVLPIHYGRSARDVLSKFPVHLTYREYPIGHQVTEESLSDVTRWLTEQLDAQRGANDVPQP